METFACEIEPPLGWMVVKNEIMQALGGPTDHYPMYMRVQDKLLVTMTCQIELDKKKWLHVAISYRNRQPSYKDMCEVKRLFVGPDKIAYQCFVPENQHVNINPYCLHLWHPCEGPVTPDFTNGTNSI